MRRPLIATKKSRRTLGQTDEADKSHHRRQLGEGQSNYPGIQPVPYDELLPVGDAHQKDPIFDNEDRPDAPVGYGQKSRIDSLPLVVNDRHGEETRAHHERIEERLHTIVRRGGSHLISIGLHETSRLVIRL